MGRNKEVDAWLARYDNPMKPVVIRIREIILAADARVDECIKWSAPTFTFEGNIASFFPKAKQHASLMFHQGAAIPGKHPILEGGGDTGRFVKIASVADADARAAELADVIRAWIGWRTSGAPKKARAKASVTGSARAGAHASGKPKARARSKSSRVKGSARARKPKAKAKATRGRR